MPTVDINITGPSYQSRSKYTSSQKTINFYPELTEGGKSQYVLHPWPGLSSFSDAVSPGRGIFPHVNSAGSEILYQVAGQEMYSVSSSGTRTTLGTIFGTNPCIFAGIGSNVVIVSGGTAYQYNGSAVSQITDADLESPNSCAHLNNQILYDGNGGRFVSADVGDATTISGLNYGTAESNADNLVRVYVYDRLAYMMGDKTIEPWENTGTGNPPFNVILGGIIQVGLGALNSVASNDERGYFLGDDKQIYAFKGIQAQRISSIGISHEIENFTVISDAQGACLDFEGQRFYRITFPTEGRTFCYSQTAGWFELSSNDGTYLASSQARCYGKNLVEDSSTGAIYELDINAFDEAGVAVIRTRDTAPLHGGLLGAPGKLVSMDRFELIMETGLGTSSGQGSSPVVMLSFSDDGGRTFSTEQFGSIGTAGQFILKVEWFGLGSFYSRIIRIRISDPVMCSILSAAADVNVAM